MVEIPHIYVMGHSARERKGEEIIGGGSQILLFLFRFVTGSHLVRVAGLELRV